MSLHVAMLKGNYLSNIPVKIKLHWPEGSGAVGF